MKAGHRIIISISLLVFAACEMVVDVNIPIEKPKLVVNAFFNPDSVWTASLSWSRHILDRKPFIEEAGKAQVSILDEKGVLVTTLKNKGRGNFVSDQKPEVGKQYTINVKVPDQELVFSTAKAIGAVPISNVTIDTLSEGELAINVTIKDPIETNYYQLHLTTEEIRKYQRWDTKEWVIDTLTMSYPLYQTTSDLTGETSQAFISDTKFNGKEITIEVTTYNPWRNQLLTASVVLTNASEAFYKYHNSRTLQSNTQGDPFAQPVQVYNNIVNGVGIFAGYADSYYIIK